MRVLLTGSSGHLAQYVTPLLEQHGHTVIPFDLPEWDVLDRELVSHAARKADACIHLAGLKYADRGELEPLKTVDVNIRGTANITQAFGPHTVVASTCKAADPETTYGCSKLIAERIALNAEARVVRFVNVLGSAGSVTDIWDATPETEPLPVCDASRLFMTHHDAANLIVSALDWPTGRYAPANPKRMTMQQVAAQLHPARPLRIIPLRRGDRQHERLLAACEHEIPHTPTAVQIIGQHDPATETTLSVEREQVAA